MSDFSEDCVLMVLAAMNMTNLITSGTMMRLNWRQMMFIHKLSDVQSTSIGEGTIFGNL